MLGRDYNITVMLHAQCKINFVIKNEFHLIPASVHHVILQYCTTYMYLDNDYSLHVWLLIE